eukprot:CAMPEP_0185772484 /NCGR_PEP_ID=MMETSP1174-20130828/69339_1 /TAXON_ID=35687 /ORGANISM="Dictyocha speculum, Strain CCMP1381" /LENGTH=155 /DNA_ID=CAMNT_0028458797 /DNA_START=78 /DNA_END=545 /DNA_ORIENTATION=-
MASVSLASMTVVAGFFGMNLEIPAAIQDQPGSFAMVTGGSFAFGALWYAAFNQAISSREVYKDGRHHLDSAVVLQNIFENIHTIEFILNKVKTEELQLTRGRFLEHMERSHSGLGEREMDVIFDIFDVSMDGVIRKAEMKTVETNFDEKEHVIKR